MTSTGHVTEGSPTPLADKDTAGVVALLAMARSVPAAAPGRHREQAKSHSAATRILTMAGALLLIFLICTLGLWVVALFGAGQMLSR